MYLHHKFIAGRFHFSRYVNNIQYLHAITVTLTEIVHHLHTTPLSGCHISAITLYLH